MWTTSHLKKKKLERKNVVTGESGHKNYVTSNQSATQSCLIIFLLTFETFKFYHQPHEKSRTFTNFSLISKRQCAL